MHNFRDVDNLKTFEGISVSGKIYVDRHDLYFDVFRQRTWDGNEEFLGKTFKRQSLRKEVFDYEF